MHVLRNNLYLSNLLVPGQTRNSSFIIHYIIMGRSVHPSSMLGSKHTKLHSSFVSPNHCFLSFHSRQFATTVSSPGVQPHLLPFLILSLEQAPSHLFLYSISSLQVQNKPYYRGCFGLQVTPKLNSNWHIN